MLDQPECSIGTFARGPHDGWEAQEPDCRVLCRIQVEPLLSCDQLCSSRPWADRLMYNGRRLKPGSVTERPRRYP